MLRMPVAEGATAAAAGRARNAAGAFQARQGQAIALPAAAAAPAAPAHSRFRHLCSLAAATCFLPLPHSANTQLALAMHLAHLILTVLLGQLLVAVARAQVQQEPSLETTEGTGVNISCSHSNIGTGDTIAWYRQLPEKGPVFLGRVHKGLRELPDIAGQLWVSADRRSSSLWLRRPRRGDAAVYYCALVARAEEPGLRPGTNRGGRGPQGPGAQRRPRPAGGAAAPPAGPQAAPQLLQCPEPAHSDSAQPATAPTHGCQPACCGTQPPHTARHCPDISLPRNP
ncbi:uncharacterized protein LOC117006303 [Catharus ustulatus]|uniref:uncharacterized protein LOC117006303 n=1 Tax=Catharus ustulatus TaxID=91951 RepID=UPI00140AFEFA|nr:uncharacterized protein LOC117006303 [Catharus ustulatus]